MPNDAVDRSRVRALHAAELARFRDGRPRSLALLERDGALMLFNWIAALVAIAFFGFSSGQLVGYTVELFQRWF